MTTRPQHSIETANPTSPSMISGLRPRLSDSRAQIGDITAHNRADSEKIAAMKASGTSISRPMAGRIDIRPVLPIATTIETANRMANDRGASMGLVGARPSFI